ASTEEFRPLGPLDRIPLGEGRTYRVADLEIAVFRTRAGELFAVQANCPHAGGPLADGLIGNGQVICPLHGRVFELASGASLRGDCPALHTYPIRISDSGEILVQLPTAQQ